MYYSWRENLDIKHFVFCTVIKRSSTKYFLYCVQNSGSNKILSPLGCMILYQCDPFAHALHVLTFDFLVTEGGL